MGSGFRDSFASNRRASATAGDRPRPLKTSNRRTSLILRPDNLQAGEQHSLLGRLTAIGLASAVVREIRLKPNAFRGRA